jgi:hypothetical protein
MEARMQVDDHLVVRAAYRDGRFESALRLRLDAVEPMDINSRLRELRSPNSVSRHG